MTSLLFIMAPYYKVLPKPDIGLCFDSPHLCFALQALHIVQQHQQICTNCYNAGAEVYMCKIISY